MFSLSDVLTPLVGEIGIGGIGGFVVGYALKKIAKVVAIFLGIGFLGLQYLSYKGFISIDYSALQTWILSLLGKSNGVQTWVTDLIIHLPFGAAFAGGFYFGLKKG
jgi:uncharacterized membrane protein (Fun14 family)